MHSDYTMLMSAALDDEATPDELQRLREHVRTCATCAGIWERWQVVDRRFDAAPFMTPAPTFTETVMARIEARSAQRRQTRQLGSRLLVFCLAALLLGLTILAGALYLGAQNPGQVSNAFFAALRGVGTGHLDFPGLPASHGWRRRADARGRRRFVGHTHVSVEHAVAMGAGSGSRGHGRSGSGALKFRPDSTRD
jgi:predicted anti-sigma-YlaC factor YlaD